MILLNIFHLWTSLYWKIYSSFRFWETPEVSWRTHYENLSYYCPLKFQRNKIQRSSSSVFYNPKFKHSPKHHLNFDLPTHISKLIKKIPVIDYFFITTLSAHVEFRSLHWKGARIIFGELRYKKVEFHCFNYNFFTFSLLIFSSCCIYLL